MSVPVAPVQHLEKVELSGSKIDIILSELGEWLLNAKFDLGAKIDKCADTELGQRCQPLFDELGLLSKFRTQQTRTQYNVIRIHSQEPIKFSASA
ncbi:uncharacterized protein EAF01_004934 [Botrytis porri]|uniref:uncharacterized protein n=1 Tax=Botrytis porri TaxID=87229 RepID=UPI001901B294|nr:uncharacterized protein EAF01_004934 [Botrytis porri]KAF7907347.1 hypothetical protein EAF01_004934 [Botrytis porri]